MENWGLVTYRERLLLVDPENTSEISKQYVALVVGKSRIHAPLVSSSFILFL